MGDLVGSCVGALVGCCVGRPDGCTEGASEGAFVGAIDGAIDGTFEGTSVGCVLVSVVSADVAANAVLGGCEGVLLVCWLAMEAVVVYSNPLYSAAKILLPSDEIATAVHKRLPSVVSNIHVFPESREI